MWTELKGFSNWGESLISAQLEHNLITFFNYGLVQKGGFYNVRMPTSGIYGGDFSRLRAVSDVRYTDGQVFESARGQWVWESGINHATQPLRVSGVWITPPASSTPVFQPLSGVGAYAFVPNYELGQVVFFNAINPSSTVRCEYSYRAAPFVSVDNSQFRRVLERASRIDDESYLTLNSGNYAASNSFGRITLPAVGVEVLSQSKSTGKEIGGGQRLYQNVALHVMSETVYERNQLADIIKMQKDKKIRMFDINSAPFPLTASGSIAAGAVLSYQNLVSGVDAGGYYYKDLIFNDFISVDYDNYSQNLFCATIRAECWVDMDAV